MDHDSKKAAEPVSQVVLADWKVPGLQHRVAAVIDASGDLVVDGYDAGKNVESTWGDNEYEFSWTIPAEWKDTLLLRLLQERFASEPEWMQHETLCIEWVRGHGIPVEFWCW